MKKKFIAAVTVCGLASVAQAAQFNVTGFREDRDQRIEQLGTIATIIGTPTTPSFSSSWSIDVDGLSLVGNMDFEPHSVHIVQVTMAQPDIVQGTLDYHYPHTILSFDMTNAVFSYDAKMRMLSVRNGALIVGGEPESCTSTWPSCKVDYEMEIPGLQENFALSLVFNPSMTTFAGLATHSWTSDYGFLGSTAYFFRGTAVPAPAAFWLFGSALAGLGVAARRRGAVV